VSGNRLSAYFLYKPYHKLFPQNFKFILKLLNTPAMFRFPLFIYCSGQVNNDSEKGRYSYDYFKLKRLEIDRFDQAQGGEGHVTIDNIEIEKEFSRLADLQGS
tara:strand:- start:1057 stop:1365 length:309 start_codon:yes stop_codon:yes gene_type:complete